MLQTTLENSSPTIKFSRRCIEDEMMKSFCVIRSPDRKTYQWEM